jgi:hypothetical protein
MPRSPRSCPSASAVGSHLDQIRDKDRRPPPRRPDPAGPDRGPGLVRSGKRPAPAPAHGAGRRVTPPRPANPSQALRRPRPNTSQRHSCSSRPPPTRSDHPVRRRRDRWLPNRLHSAVGGTVRFAQVEDQSRCVSRRISSRGFPSPDRVLAPVVLTPPRTPAITCRLAALAVPADTGTFRAVRVE